MRKAQFNAIEKFARDKIVKVIDENFEKPPAIIIYAQKERGDSILEYVVTPSGTVEFSFSYNCSKALQEFFDSEPSLTEVPPPEKQKVPWDESGWSPDTDIGHG